MKQLFTRYLLVSMLLLMGVTTGVAQKSVLDESFAGGSKPTGWTSGDYWNFSNGCALFDAPFENGADTMATPLLSLGGLDNQPSVAITYSNAANGDKVNEFTLLYRASETAEWTVLKTFNQATDTTDWKGVLPDDLTNVQIAVAGAYKLGGAMKVYRLAVENKTEATAPPTGLKYENLTTTGVTLWWDVCSSPKFVQYNVKVSTKPMTDKSAEADVVDNVGWMITDEFYELSGLTPNTEYWLYVQYDCGDGDLSPWAELNFRTPCEAISGSFYEDFEGEISGCYTIIDKGTAVVSSEYAYNSQKSFKSTTAKGKYNYFILPEFAGEVKDYQVAFMAAAADGGNTYARTVTVGVCTEATEERFTEVKTLNLPKGRVWESIVVTLKGYTGTGKYIAFRLGNEDKDNRIFIDDIRIESASVCPKPMFLEVSEINPNSAKLKWVETGNASEWNLVLSTKLLADPEDIEPDEARGEYAGPVSTNPYTAANLLPNTTYYAYLQAGCGSSEWTNAVEFKTNRTVTYPYAEHFDRMEPELYTNNTVAIPSGWVMDNRGNNNQTSNTYYDKQYTSDTYLPYVTTVMNHQTTAYVSASLLLCGTSIASSTSPGYTSIAILPAMPKAVNTMMVTFWAYTASAQTIAVGVANTQTNDLDQGKQLGANITEVATVAVTGDNEWKQYKVRLTDYTGEGRYIAFYLKPGNASPSVYIDDIEIDEAPDCDAVATLSAEATGIDKATVTWTDASSSTSWILKVSSTEIDPGTTNGDIVAAKTVNTKTYNLTGLTMGTTYYIYLSPTCDDMWTSTSVTTLVGLQVPYYNDFQSEPVTGAKANRSPENWKLGYTYTDTPTATSTYYPYLFTTAYAAANNPPADAKQPYLYIYTAGTGAAAQSPYAIMPELLNSDVKNLKLVFYGYYNSTTTTANYAAKAGGPFGQLHIGVVNSPNDVNKTDKFNKVTHVATVRCAKAQTVEQFVVDLSGYTGTGKYLIFYSDTAKYNYFGIDNLYVLDKNAPLPPAAVADVAVSEITKTTATVTWTEKGEATQWNVRVFNAAQEDPSAGEPVFSTMVNTMPSAAITGLSASTQYHVYVQSVQANGNGVWVNTTFFTECDMFALPFTEDWESWSTGTNTLSSCFTQTPGAQVAPSSSPNASVKTGQVFKFNATSSNSEPMLVLPEFDKPINTLQLTMNASPYTASYVGDASYTEIGVLEGENFVKIAEYRFNLSDVKAWDEVFVNFGTYSGTGGRIAIRSSYIGSKTTHICFDNLVVEEIPLCGRITTIDVTDIDSVSANISWAKGKAENKWNLKVSSTALEDPVAVTADIFDGQLDQQTKTLTDLEGNTTYYVYVQSVDEVLECTGTWSNAKTFKTLCKKLTFPYEEDFEDYETGSGKDMGCFIQCGDDPSPSYITTKGTNNKALWLRQATKDHNNYFVFPALAIDSVKRLQLSMQVYVGTSATYTYPFEVGVMTDPNDPATFVATHNEALVGQTAAYDRVYTFEGYAGDETGTKFGTFIALKPLNYKNASGTEYVNNSVYIDNVTIDFIETCVAPVDLKADSVGTYGAKLIWNTDDKTAAHRVRIYADAAAKPNDGGFVAEAVVYDTVAILDGLSSLTNYYAYVRKECAVNDLSKWSSACRFKTECPETRAIPYVEEFEGETEPLADYCWNSFMVQGSASCTTDYRAKASTTAKKEGTRGLYLQYIEIPSEAGGSCVGTHRATAVTPALEIETLKDLLVYFDVKSSSSTNIKGGVKIEAVSDDTPDAEAIYITTVSDIPNSWAKAYVNIGDFYTSVQPYKRLRFTTTTGTSVYIDNIVFTNDKSVILPVQDVKLLTVTENTAKFSFVEYTPTITEWQVAYVATDGDIADATTFTTQEKEVTITGLTANVSYDIYVRSENTEWVGPITATTIQTPTPLPLITGFEDEADNTLWTMYNIKTVDGQFYPNFWIVGKADACLGTGNNAMFITNDSASYLAYDKNTYVPGGEVATSYVWATRNINIEDAGTYKFSIKYKVPKCYSSDGLYAQLIPAGATFKASNATLLSGISRAGSATQNENGCYLVMNKQENVKNWTWCKSSLDIEEAGIYTLALYWYNPSAGEAYATPAAIDSVIVEEYICTTPKNFEYVSRKANEVTIKWFGGKCRNFEYVVSRYAKLGMPNLIDEEDKVAAGMLTDGPQVTIGNLLPNTDYSLYVRTICDDGTTDWVQYDFLTPCGLIELPYTENFTEAPECWILKSANIGTQNYKAPDMTEAEKWSSLVLNKGGIVVLPELNVDIKNVEMELALFNSTNLGAVSLGIMDNTWDVPTFQQIEFFQTVNKLSSTTSTGNPYVLETFSKMFNLYKGTGKVLAIKNATDNTVYVKYVTLTELPDCIKPQQVELTYQTSNAVTVNWLAGSEEAWEIQINDSLIENVTTNPYRITDLEQGTVYTVAVRAICDAENKSEWSLPTTFQTTCGVNSLPMSEDFSGLTKPLQTTSLVRAALTCWENMVTTYGIDYVFQGKDKPVAPASNVYAGNMWVSNWLSMLGDYAQLHSYHNTGTVAYRYKWFISPQYAIDGKASLSFDARSCNNVGNAPKGNQDRFFVAISTDNGTTWKAEDATELTAELDSTYKTLSVSLDKYIGKNIRVAFYSENNSATSTKIGESPFLLIDNVRMNCIEEYGFIDNACQGYDYQNVEYGFSIKAEELPVAGSDSTYYRFALNTENGCDSVIALTLTTRQASEVTHVYATICEGEVYQFGGQSLTKPNPEDKPYFLSSENQYGCDSTIYLYLTVTPNDTTDITVSVKAEQLPYSVDEYYTVPVDAKVGSFEETLPNGEMCGYNRYIVTVSGINTGIIYLTDDVDRIEVFDVLGRKVRTIRKDDDWYHLPTGVYMLQTVMKSGKVEYHKITMK